jgi:hypothetical protein
MPDSSMRIKCKATDKIISARNTPPHDGNNFFGSLPLVQQNVKEHRFSRKTQTGQIIPDGHN